jgi:archaellum component FlaC
MALIPDGEALDILARLQAIEAALGDLATKVSLTDELAEITTEIQALRNEVGGIQTRFKDLKTRYEQLAVRVADLEP